MRPKTPKPKARLKTKTNANTEASNGPRRNTGAMGGSAGGSIYGVCDDDLGGQANHYWRSAYGNGWGHSFDNGHEDWALCDKDCGWCGHCADNIDI
ncbi:hypothetical protein CC78DRAFT_239172 [Lojkania enalia]|uniref:Uncharacterized protein n=1 Tax=Lojkania enalia TaxID=147567 RepID=A0A9P4TQM5_9PLEO|nr:hypothetical protein CC78DRAFT_239172 [Didymosphaeria enalia]